MKHEQVPAQLNMSHVAQIEPPAAIASMRNRARAREILLIAAWFGMAAGLAEGFSFLVLQSLGWVSWETRLVAVDPNILWASPLIDVPLSLLIGVGVLLFARFAPKFNLVVITTGIFATGAFYALLATSGRLQGFGVAMLALGVGVLTARWMSRDTDRHVAFLRRSLIPLLCLTMIAGIGGAAAKPISTKLQVARLPAAPAGAPNVLLIVLDDLRADHVGTYGYSRAITPFLDEYAKQGVLFEKAFANSSWSLTSHASLFTGKLPYQHGATLFPYDGRYPTLAQVLASHGYATAGFAANTYFLTEAQGLAKGFQRWDNIFTGPVDSARRTLLGRKFEAIVAPHFGLNTQPGRMNGEQINSHLFQWLDRRPNRPFFVFLNYMRMHAPYSPSQEEVAKFTSKPDEVLPPHGLAFHLRARSVEEPADAAARNILYDASLAQLDTRLRGLVDGLRTRGLEKNLMVIITSDHGELLGEHGMIGHGTALYLQQIHVPLIIVSPGRVPAGQRISAPVGLSAIPASVAELANLSGESREGSLAGCWSGGACGSGSVISELVGGDFPGIERTAPNRQGWIKSVIDARWHFLLQQNGAVSLFDWAADPGEQTNLAEAPAGKDVAARFGAVLSERVPEASSVWALHSRAPETATSPSSSPTPAK